MNKAQEEYNKLHNLASADAYNQALSDRVKLLKEEQQLLLKTSTGNIGNGMSVQEIREMNDSIKEESDAIAKESFRLEEQSLILEQNASAQKIKADADEAAQISLEKLISAYEESSSKVSDYRSKLDDLASINKEISNDEKISKTTLLDLLDKYPDYTQQIMLAVGSKQKELDLTKILFEATKQKLLAENRGMIENLRAQEALNGVSLIALDIQREQIKQAAALIGDSRILNSLSPIDAKLAKWDALYSAGKVIASLTMEDLQTEDKTASKKGDTPEQIAKKSIDSAIDAQKQITDAVKQGVDDRKEAIQDEYDAYAKSIDDQIDKNKELWDSQDYDKNVEKQMSVIDDLTSEKNSYLNAAMSGDLTARAKVIELDKKIADEREKLTEQQTDRSRDLQTDSLNEMKSVAEDAKDAEIKRLETVFNETKSTATAMQALFQSNLNGFSSILSKYLAGLGLAKSEIEKIMASATSAFGQAQAGVKIAGKAGVSSGEFGAYAEGFSSEGQQTKSAMQVKMEASGASASQIKADLASIISYQSKWTTATDAVKKELNAKAIAIRKKYGIDDASGSKFPAWSYVGSYAYGGEISNTGIAQVHGSKARPEYMLNFDQARQAVSGNYQNTPLKNLANSTNSSSGSITFGSLINVEGNLDKSTIPDLERITNDVLGKLKWTLNKSGGIRFAT